MSDNAEVLQFLEVGVASSIYWLLRFQSLNLKQCVLGKLSTVCMIAFYETFKLEAEEACLTK